MNAARGFTLLEILVALAILAIGLAAATRACMSATDTAAALQQRQLAGWVAENQLALLRAARQFPAPGQSSGEARMGQRTFRWTMAVDTAAQGYFRRVEIAVREASGEADVLARLVGYLGRP